MDIKYSIKDVIDMTVLIAMSILGFFLVQRLIRKCSSMFVESSKAKLYGKDLCKSYETKTPESQGLWCGVVYFIIMFLFMPISNTHYLSNNLNVQQTTLIQHLAALLSICCMTMLGFVDDVLDLRWRHKLLLPTVASLPLLIVYYISGGTTNIVVPVLLRSSIGDLVDIGPLYYVYMGMLAVFCTNAINIYAGINGIEAGQSVVIALSIIVFNSVEFLSGSFPHYHLFSLIFTVPYLFTSLGLLQANWYPASVFVGDTFCYFSGMTFAVVGILGHFSKTLLLFFIPQTFNFLYSVPQLFHFIPCPRHRLPKYLPEKDRVTQSTTKFRPQSLNHLGKVFFWLLRTTRLVHVTHLDDGFVEMNNLTIINLALFILGDQHEEQLTKKLLYFQVFCSCVAFFVRYPLAWIFY